MGQWPFFKATGIKWGTTIFRSLRLLDCVLNFSPTPVRNSGYAADELPKMDLSTWNSADLLNGTACVD